MDTTAPLVHMVITFIIMWLVLLPVFILWIWRAYRVQRCILMRKRYIDGSLCCCIFLLLWLYVSRSLEFIRAYLFIQGYSQYQSFSTFYCIEQMIYPYCGHGAVYTLLYRFWMIHFEFIYNESLENKQWKVHINPKGSSKKEKWIIDHRKDYGNSKWIAIRFTIIYVLLASFSATLRLLTQLGHFDSSKASIADSALYLTPLISVFILWYKMPSFKDSFLVKDELKWIIIVYAIGLLGNTVLVIYFRMNPDFNMYWNESMWFVVIFFVCSLIIFLQTQYIFIRIRQNVTYFRDILTMNDMYDMSATGGTKEHSYSSQSGASGAGKRPSYTVNTKRKLNDILMNKATFNLFMHHISTEFSTECMFAFIEFTQFQMLLETDQTFMDNIKTHTDKNLQLPKPSDSSYALQGGNYCKFMVSYKQKKAKVKNRYDKVVLLDEETIPLSHIVYNEEYSASGNLNRYKCIVSALAEKYIYDSGDFCININFNTRYNIIEWVNRFCGDMEVEFELEQYCEMYHLFEKCRQEMYKLMQATFSRFVKTDQFLSIAQ